MVNSRKHGYTFYVNNDGVVSFSRSARRSRTGVDALAQELASCMKQLLPLYRRRKLSFGTITYLMGIQIVRYGKN